MAVMESTQEPGRHEIRLNFTVQHWCLWQAADILNVPSASSYGEILPANGGIADVGFLPRMQSRRLSPLAMAANAVAWHCQQKCGQMASVFYSEHGESQYYYEMLEDMAAQEPMSPSRFSLCVHNAIAGLSSFYSNSTLPYVSLAGGTDGLFAAFLEVGGMLLEADKVLLVCYEQPLPDAYRSYLVGSETAWAFAMALGKIGDSGRQLRLTRRPDLGGAVTEGCAQQLVKSIIEGRSNSLCHLGRSVWQWGLGNA